MNQYTQENFLGPGVVGLGTECRSELALVLGEGAFDVRPLTIDTTRKAAFECTTIAPLGPRMVPAVVDGGDQRSDPQELPAEDMMMVAVVCSVGQDLIQGDPGCRFHHRRSEVGGVVGRASAYLSREPEVGAGVAEHRELGKRIDPELPGVGALAAVVEADVPGFVSGGIDRPFGLVLDQAATMGVVGNRVEQSIETPFLRRRL